MRSVLALGLLITLGVAANAAPLHHFKSRYVVVHPSEDAIPVFGSPEWERLHREDIPDYDDPSKFGG